jgi:hypothetical protein
MRSRFVGAHMRTHRDDLLSLIDRLPSVGD